MKRKNKALSIGLVLLLIGGVTLFVERAADSAVSGTIGRLYCGDAYLQAPGRAGDAACGFNMDMVVGLACFLIILAGLIFVLIGGVRLIANRKNN